MVCSPAARLSVASPLASVTRLADPADTIAPASGVDCVVT
jgi:hypothetical protein